MTNVPDNIREMWKEMYILFDTHFLMDVNNQDNWKDYWGKAVELIQKYDIPNMVDMLQAMADIICERAKWRDKNGCD